MNGFAKIDSIVIAPKVLYKLSLEMASAGNQRTATVISTSLIPPPDIDSLAGVQGP